jgi:MoxR-like ATPase
MSWPTTTIATIKRLQRIQRKLKDTFADRDVAIDLLTLSALCQEHLLLIGPPGTAKTELIHKFTELIDARGFHYLLSRFTEPSELFGPLDLRAFQDRRIHICTENMLPEAEISFLDEVFQGSSAILNSLLTLVNERVFYNGSVAQPVPLLCLIGASNVLPDDPGLRAFADRFPLRLQIDPVAPDHLFDLIDQGWELERQRIDRAAHAGGMGVRAIPEVKRDDLKALHNCLLDVNVKHVRQVYGDVVRELRAEGVDLSDRRIVKGMKLVAGAALLREASEAEVQDLWPLNHFWTKSEEVDSVRGVIEPRIKQAGGPAAESTRAPEAILKDLELLVSREPSVRTHVALGAHLMDLNRLRREAIRSHREDGALRNAIEGVIQKILNQLEGAHV